MKNFVVTRPDILYSVKWACPDCKKCEICQKKGRGNRMLFCDVCDRGWHMYCMDPPVEEDPEGAWYCPQCVSEVPQQHATPYEQPSSPLPHREPSVASSSRSHTASNNSHAKARSAGKGKGKALAVITDDSELDVEVDVEREIGTPIATGRPIRNKRPSKRKAAQSRNEDYSEDEVTLSARQPKRRRTEVSSAMASTTSLPRLTLRFSTQQKGKGKEREDEEKGMFDDFLLPEQRDTMKTMVDGSDRQRFDRTRQLAEAKLAARVPPPPTSASEEAESSSSVLHPTRLRLAALANQTAPIPGPSASPGPPTPTPLLPGSGPRVKTIHIGGYDVKTWYDAPFSEEYSCIPDGKLWICEFCLKYMKSKFGYNRHRMKCKARHPPGDEIYRDGDISLFEVDGRKNKIYCQNLCLLSKMFLDHKSLFYDVEPFLFYVIAQVDDDGARFIGYFSKEKCSIKDYNLSCIMTLPTRQRQGWGNFLIDFSYLLSKKEQRQGSPEKPLSSLGALGYRNYWALSLMRYLENGPEHPRLEDISAATSMTIEDVYNTLVQQEMITVLEEDNLVAKPSPGQSIKINRRKTGGARNNVARRLQRATTKEEPKPKGPFAPPLRYEIHWDAEKVDRALSHWESKGQLKVKSEKLKWSPYLLTRENKAEMQGSAKEAENEGSAADAMAVGLALFDDDVAPADDVLPVMSTEAEASPVDLFADDTDIVVETRARSKAKSTTPTPSQPSKKATGRRKATKRVASISAPIQEEPTSEVDDMDVPPPFPSPTEPRLQSNGVPVVSPVSPSADGTAKSNKKAAALMVTIPGTGNRVTRQRTAKEINASPANEEAAIATVPASPQPEPMEGPEHDSEMTVQVEKLEPAPLPEATTIPSLPGDRPAVVNGDDAEEATTVGKGEHEDDVKCEEVGTPLTSLTSRQSVPSDDTLFVVGTGMKAAGDLEEEDADADYDPDVEEMECSGRMRSLFGCGVDPTQHGYPKVSHPRSLSRRRLVRPGRRLAGTDHDVGSEAGSMQYTITPSDSRRDGGLDGSAPFQSHQSLGQALGTHLPPSAYHPQRSSDYRISPSPSPIHPHHPHAHPHPHHPHPQNGGASSSSSFTSQTSPTMSLKRKLVDGAQQQLSMQKRRRDAEDSVVDGFDGGQGAKHWTDEEKSKLFNWLMGPGQDDHWNSLRATKNSCLRECSLQVFGSKKTYQALKGCYERNFNLFKQIYAFESWHSHQLNGGIVSINGLSEADRLKEYERRLQGAKKAGCDVGNITARTIDHWHRVGWYQLFYTRWHGDPATTRPSVQRVGSAANGAGPVGDDPDPVDVDDSGIDFDSNLAALSSSHEPLTFINAPPAPSPATIPPPPPPPPPIPLSPHTSHTNHTNSTAVEPHGNIALSQGMLNAFMQFLQIQTQTGKMKLDYLRRREEREEKESSQRRELERLRIEREQAEFEHTKQTANLKQKADRAIALLENPNVDPSVKAAAGDYLKKVFTAD
ncbi:hypothetical protein IW262DRAFT_1268713 [Armillaria fumosa]|nr:hypothetical protein IW262DRAFT_1268713 [Armillaria fumosa]